ncbi:MAG: hypothetical protein ACTHMY_02725 [Solirubrobacteraceae bacterium]
MAAERVRPSHAAVPLAGVAGQPVREHGSRPVAAVVAAGEPDAVT